MGGSGRWGGRGRYGWGEKMVWGGGKERMGWGRGVELRILIQKPGVRGITPPLASKKSAGSSSRAAPSVISWPQHSDLLFIAVGCEF